MNARVFLLVTEGESDECVADALNECVGARFTGIAAHGDVTVMSVGTHGVAWASAKDTMGTIRGIIRGEAQRTHEFALRDVVGVAQLTDLDGAYIPDRLVKEGDMRLRYSDACIETCDVQGIIARNRRKRHAMDLMSGWRSIRLTGGREVPYRLFYCSRNLEHALHGLPGDVGVDDKRILSTRVSAHAMRDPAWFHDLVGSPDVSHGVSGLVSVVCNMFNHTCFYLKWIGLYGILVTMGKKVSIGRAALILGVSVSTLRRWDEEGRLVAERTKGGQRRYDMDQLTHQTARQADDTRTTIAYARVSSADQKNDLERQRNVLELYCAKNGWQYELVSDIGSGMNYRKKGLTRLLDAILDDRVGRLVITHKDRLLRFGAELMFAVCEAKHVEVVIINQGDEQRSFEEELASDVLEIITVFSARMYGARSHKSHKLIEEMTKAVDDAQSA